MFHEVAQSLLDLLFPPRCLHCRTAGAVICPACIQGIAIPRGPLCERCGRALHVSSAGTEPCASCAQGIAPVSLSRLRAATLYEGLAREAVLALKYEGTRRLAEPLGDLLAAAARRDELTPDLVVAVPLHDDRQRERGYNQAQLLARRCAWRLGAPLAMDVLTRQRATMPQVGLSAAQRRVNVEGAFVLAHAAATSKLAGKRILLIDDVTTTGSTLDAAAAALLPARPAAIWGLAVTRPELGDDGSHERQLARTGSRGRAGKGGR